MHVSLLPPDAIELDPEAATARAEDAASVEELRRTLAARDKLIALLSKRLEAGAPPASLPANAQQSHVLERIVARKTEQLEKERFELEKALTELRTTQDRLLQAQKLESIGELAAGVAHELNTPTQYVTDNVGFLERGLAALLQVIDTALQTAERIRMEGRADLVQELDAVVARARLDYLREQIPRALEQSLEGLERVASIVRAMKEFSHPEVGAPERVNLGELIDTTVTLARNEWKYVAEMVTDIDPALPLVSCLRQQLSQAILNLIVNAAHAVEARSTAEGRDKGHIVIGAQLRGADVEIRVTDDGTGIAPEIRSRIFDPFFTTKPVGQGTGQGLALVFATIVKKHQGQVRVESQVGRGTAMILQIPLALPAAAES